MKTKNKLLSSKLLLVVALCFTIFACDSSPSEDETPETPGNTGNIENNTLVADGQKKQLNVYTFSNVGNYVEITARESLNVGVANIAIRIKDLPATNTTLTFQDDSNDPAQIQTDEFWTQMNDGTQVWYPVFTSTAFETTGKMEITVSGDIITFTYSDLQLNDNYISTNITKTVSCSGKFSLKISELDMNTNSGQSGTLATL